MRGIMVVLWSEDGNEKVVWLSLKFSVHTPGATQQRFPRRSWPGSLVLRSFREAWWERRKGRTTASYATDWCHGLGPLSLTLAATKEP